jgi:hypothetical protein
MRAGRGIPALLSVLVLAMRLATAAEAASTLEMSADGEVQIATDGSVSDYRLHSELAPSVAGLIDKQVRSWHFEPVVIDGKAVLAKSAMHLSLKAEPTGDAGNYRVVIASVLFGGARQHDHIKQPLYPTSAVSAHLGAKVLLAIRLDENGKVLDVQPYQTSLDARPSSERDAERWRKMFDESSVRAARFWTFDLAESVNGKPIGTTVIVPVVYSLSNVPGSSPSEGRWKAYLPGPVHPAPWMTGDHALASADLSGLAEGQSMSLDSHIHLKDDVIGKAL